jgi:hypothetical protein
MNMKMKNFKPAHFNCPESCYRASVLSTVEH